MLVLYLPRRKSEADMAKIAYLNIILTLKILCMMKNSDFKTCTILVALFIGITLHAQQISVKGTVVEKSTGLSVIGASVIEVGSENNGTITDIDGNFSLTVSQGSELSVSYIGFQAVTVKAQPTVRIEMMEDSQMLNEVVVTGYMSEKKASLTGSVAVVKRKMWQTFQPEIFLQDYKEGLQV